MPGKAANPPVSGGRGKVGAAGVPIPRHANGHVPLVSRFGGAAGEEMKISTDSIEAEADQTPVKTEAAVKAIREELEAESTSPEEEIGPAAAADLTDKEIKGVKVQVKAHTGAVKKPVSARKKEYDHE
jgi:hypothetical protein